MLLNPASRPCVAMPASALARRHPPSGARDLQTAAESDRLKAIGAGAGSRSLRDDLARTGTGKWREIPSSLVITAGTMLFSNHAAPPNLKSLVGRIAPRAVLFIYGQHDQATVRELTPGYYAAAGEPKAIWEVAGASHTGGIDAHAREYEQRVTASSRTSRVSSREIRVRAQSAIEAMAARE
jgi:hypothetical protein